MARFNVKHTTHDGRNQQVIVQFINTLNKNQFPLLTADLPCIEFFPILFSMHQTLRNLDTSLESFPPELEYKDKNLRSKLDIDDFETIDHLHKSLLMSTLIATLHPKEYIEEQRVALVTFTYANARGC